MTSTVQRVLTAIGGQVGYHEGRSGGHWNNIEKYAAQVPGLAWANGQPWCAVFASWGYLKGGLKPNVDFPVTASCDAAAAWYKKQGRWSEYPAIGAQVLFGTPADLTHTGIVVDYDGTSIDTVEGNTNNNGSREGDGVYRMHHLRKDARVVGYGLPKFPEGITSADPKFAKQRSSTTNVALLKTQLLALLHKYEGRISPTRVLVRAGIIRIRSIVQKWPNE